MPNFLARLLIICLAGCSGLSAATISWNGAGPDNYWSTAANWVGGALPAIGDTAAFPAASSVTIDSGSAVAASILGSPTITIPSAGTLTVTGAIPAAAIIMDGGQLNAATVGATITATPTHGGTLSGITIGSTGVLSLVDDDGAHCTITNGITIDGSVVLGAEDGTTTGYLVCSGSQSWAGSSAGGGNADIVFGWAVGNAIQVRNGSDTLTLLNGLTLHGLYVSAQLGSGNTLVNQALIECTDPAGAIAISGALSISNAPTGTLTNGGIIRCATGSSITSLGIAVGSWSNAGTIEADGASASLNAAGTSVNDGQIIDNGGELTLGGSWDPAGTGSIACTGISRIILTGSYPGMAALHVSPSPMTTFTLSGTMTTSVLDLSTLGPMYLFGGTITGGSLHPPVTIIGNGGNTLIVDGNGTLDNAVIAPSTVLDLATQGGQCVITNGLTVNGSVIIGGTASTTSGTLYCVGTQSWGGSTAGGGPADIVFGTSPFNSIQDYTAAADTLTLLPGLTIHGIACNVVFNAGQTIINDAVIEVDGDNCPLSITGGCALVNAGTISGHGNQDPVTFAVSSFTNQGVISIGSGSAQSWTCTGDFTQSPSGTLNFVVTGLASDPAERFSITGNASLAGAITVVPAGGYLPHQGDSWNLMPVTGTTASTASSTNAMFALSYPGSGLVATVNDATTPSVVVSVAPSTSQSPIPFLLTFSEPVSAPGLGGLAVTNGAATSISGGPTAYTALINPTVADGPVGVAVLAGDAVNSGSVGNAPSATATTAYHTAPILVISPADNTVTATVPIFTISSSVPVSGLSASGLLVGGAAIGAITQVDPSTITVAMVMGHGGAVSFAILAGALSDAQGGVNAASPIDLVTYAPAGSAVWTGAGRDYRWSTAANWLANAVPGDGADVIIPPWVTVYVDIPTANLHSVDLRGTIGINPATTLQVGSGPAGTNILTLDGGTLNIGGGTLQSAIVQAGSGGGTVTVISDGTVDGVTIGADVIFDLSDGFAVVQVVDGLTIDGVVLVGDAIDASLYSRMQWQGSQTWAGSGEIRFGASPYNTIIETASPGATLTIADPLRIHGTAVRFDLDDATSVLATASQNGLGGLSADAAGDGITINLMPGTWTNTGTIVTAPRTALSVGGFGSWSSSGAISGSGTIYGLGGHFTTASLVTFSAASGNTINIEGELTGDATLNASGIGPWYLAGGSIDHSVIGSAPAGGRIIATEQGGNLLGVSIGAGAVLAIGEEVNGFCAISYGMTVDGSVHIGSLDPLAVTGGTVNWNGSQGWIGSGDVVLGQSAAITCTTAGTLTFYPPLLIHGYRATFSDTGSSAIVNQSTIASDVARGGNGGGFSFTTTSLTNQGTMTLGVGSADSWSCSGTFTQTASGILNLAAISPGHMSELRVGASASLAGTINLNPAGGYIPQLSAVFTVVSTAQAGVTGAFATVTGPFAVTYQDATVTAEVLPSGNPMSIVTSAAFANASPIPFTLNFLAAVDTPAAGDLEVAGGSVASISGGPWTYTALVTPVLAGGTSVVVSVRVPAGVVSDGGPMENSASNLCACTYEIPPTVTVLPASGTAVASAPVFTVIFSNPVQGLQASGISLSGTGASLVAISPGATTLTSTYFITTALSDRETVHFGVLANAVTDQAGNANAASAVVDVVGNSPPPPAPAPPAPTAPPADGNGHRCGLGSGLAALACALMILARFGVRTRR